MSSNTNIGNTPVNQGYVQLIHTGETGGIDGTLRTLYDGDGTASDLQIASNKVKVSTELYIGSKTATEFIQDIVGSMFTTGSYTNITTTYDDTNGNIDLSASGEVTLTGTQTLTNKTLASPTFTGTANGANLTLTGDLTVSGDTIFTNSNTVLIGDAILTLNADETGSPTANAGFEVERGTSTNKTFIWNETDDKWTIGSETFVASTVEANLTGNVTGNVTGSASLNLLKSSNLSDLASASTARSNLGVDAAGTDNSTNVTLAGSLDYITLSGQEITRNAINLGTDVTSQLPIVNGGTGASDANTARENLGLEIGLDVQAYDAGLLSIATLTTSANKMIYTTASDTYATTTLSSTARTLLDDNTTADMLTTLGLTATATELNYTDGVTSNIQTQLNGKLGTSAKAADSELLDGINSTSFVQTSRSITPVSQRGISGGGDLSADRTIELSASQLGSVALTTSDQLILFDQSDSDIPKRFNAQDIFDTISGAVTVYGNTGDNRVLTSGGGTTINGESNLTFDGTNLDLPDSKKVRFGTDNDFEFYHDDTNAVINNTKGDLQIYNNADDKDIVLLSDDGSGGTTAYLTLDGSSGYTTVQKLIKFEDSVDARFGTGSNLRIRHDGTNSKIDNYTGTLKIRNTLDDADITLETDNGSGGLTPYITLAGSTGHLNLAPPNNVGIGTASPGLKLDVAGDIGLKNNATYLYSKDASGTSTRMFGMNSGNTTYIGPIDSYAGGSILYGASSNVVDQVFYTSGAERMRIKTSTGNVGIGTGSPSVKLQVADTSTNCFIRVKGGTGNFAGIDFGDNDDDDISRIRHSNSDNSLRFSTNNTEQMRIDSSGNVGIGEDDIDARFHISTASSGLVNQKFESTGSSAWRIGIPAGQTYFAFDDSSDDLSSPEVVFTTAGNVGIGTTSPDKKLEVSGDIKISGGDYNGLYFENAAGTTKTLLYQHAATDSLIIKDIVNNADRVTFKNNGNVGIGTTSPGVKLDVSGQARATNGMLVDNGTTAGFFTTDSDNVNFGASTSGKGLKLFSANTERLRIVSGGDAHFDQDVIAFSTTPSDRRLKTNIKDIDYGLDTIMQLSPKKYDWKKDNRHDIGFIAQEVEQVIPEIVKDKKHFDKEIKTLDYEKLTAVLIKAVQEQQQQINKLEEKLNG